MEKRVLYNTTLQFSNLYHVYYKNMQKVDREIKGNYVEKLLAILLEQLAEMYFSEYDFNNLKMLIHKIDFEIRDLYNCKIISKKQKINLSRFIAILLDEFQK